MEQEEHSEEVGTPSDVGSSDAVRVKEIGQTAFDRLLEEVRYQYSSIQAMVKALVAVSGVLMAFAASMVTSMLDRIGGSEAIAFIPVVCSILCGICVIFKTGMMKVGTNAAVLVKLFNSNSYIQMNPMLFDDNIDGVSRLGASVVR